MHCIETHVYPTWSTDEEFKQLPDYKYFNKKINRLLLISMPNDTKHSFVKVGDQMKKIIAEPQTRAAYVALLKQSTLPGMPDYPSVPNCRVELVTRELDGKIKYSSENKVCDVLHPYIFKYFELYIFGWFMQNAELVSNRKSYAVITVDQTCMIQIYRSDKLYRQVENHVDVIYFPVIKEFIIDGLCIEN